MFVKRLFRLLKPFVPVWLYRHLSFGYRAGLERAVKQLEADDRAYLAEHPGVLVPPADLRTRVIGPCSIRGFLDSGREVRDGLEAALSGVGRSFADCESFLDFGCGCGRIALAFADAPNRPHIVGADIDPESIGWCRENIPFGEFHVNNHRPPLPFDDATFDVVSTTSVFTHLDEVDQFLWLAELRRVLKPDGVLLASVHGRECVQHYPYWVRRKIADRGFVYARTDAESKWFPSWYQVAWHSREYIDREWSRLFAIRDYRPRAINAYQDLVVAQKQTVAARKAA